MDGQSASRESRVKYAEQMKKCCYILLEFCEQQKRKNNPNYKYILDRISRYYQTGFRTILLKEINNYNRNELIQFEKHSKSICESVYFKSAKIGKAGLFIKVFRITGYLAYWILKLFKLPNWK